MNEKLNKALEAAKQYAEAYAKKHGLIEVEL